MERENLNSGIRINRFLAEAGVCSRRKADELVLAGLVCVNGKVMKEPGFIVAPGRDRVSLYGRAVERRSEKLYIVLNKPEGVITSASDERGRKTVMDFVSDAGRRLHYAGRLDFDTSGLVLMTDDGEISRKLTLPENRVPKTYRALVRGTISPGDAGRIRNGIEIDGRLTLPARVRCIKKLHDASEIEITVAEGRKRQVRRMFDEIGHPVLKLKRISIGRLELGRLKEGCWRKLKKHEMEYLMNLKNPGHSGPS